jgi:hypothetical protein
MFRGVAYWYACNIYVYYDKWSVCDASIAEESLTHVPSQYSARVKTSLSDARNSQRAPKVPLFLGCSQQSTAVLRSGTDCINWRPIMSQHEGGLQVSRIEILWRSKNSNRDLAKQNFNHKRRSHDTPAMRDA